MTRLRLTQIAPWLLPLRKKQRLFCFYAKMRLDGRRYATELSAHPLPEQLFAASTPLYNRQTGMPMLYQDNKVFNLKLAAATLNGLLIKPGEVFSFWQLVRWADARTPYREGLVQRDGRLQTVPGGGMCELSNFLFWLLLHAPVQIVERHGHRRREFPAPASDKPCGVDATVAEGWLDLKLQNISNSVLQIRLNFDDEQLHGQVLAEQAGLPGYEIINGQVRYLSRQGAVYEEAQVVRRGQGRELLLYTNCCRIDYQLPPEVVIVDIAADDKPSRLENEEAFCQC